MVGDANIYPRLQLYWEEILSWWLCNTPAGTKLGSGWLPSSGLAVRTGSPSNCGRDGSWWGTVLKWGANGCSTADQLWGEQEINLQWTPLLPILIYICRRQTVNTKGIGTRHTPYFSTAVPRGWWWDGRGRTCSARTATVLSGSVEGLSISQKPWDTSERHGAAKWFQALLLPSAKPHVFACPPQPEVKALLPLTSSGTYFGYVKYSAE